MDSVDVTAPLATEYVIAAALILQILSLKKHFKCALVAQFIKQN